MLGTSSFKVFSEHDILTLVYHGAKWKVTFNKSKKVATNKRTPFWVVKENHGKFHWFIDAPSFCVFFQVPFSMRSLLNHLTLRNTGSQNWSGLEIPTNPLKYREIPFSLDGPSWFLGHTPEIEHLKIYDWKTIVSSWDYRKGSMAPLPSVLLYHGPENTSPPNLRLGEERHLLSHLSIWYMLNFQGVNFTTDISVFWLFHFQGSKDMVLCSFPKPTSSLRGVQIFGRNGRHQALRLPPFSRRENKWWGNLKILLGCPVGS